MELEKKRTPKIGIGKLKKSLLLRQAIRFSLLEGEKSITEFCKHMHMSAPTGAKLVRELIAQNVFVESGKRDSSSGRKPTIFSLNPFSGYVVCAELLLNRMLVNILNLNHEVIYEFKSSEFDIVRENETYQYLVEKIPAVIREAKIPISKVIGIGIAIKGMVSMKRGISYTYLSQHAPLRDILEKVWQIPVFIDNDARLMAMGEKRFGLAHGKSNVIYVNLSHGLGLGIISNGLIHGGHSGFSGEFGHIQVANNNKQCVCGKVGCLETIVSGLALEDLYKTEFNRETSYEDIFQEFISGNDALSKIFFSMGEQLGKELGTIVNIFNPELIIIGGSFSPIADAMKPSIVKGISLRAMPKLVNDCEIQTSLLGERAVMLGAFSLVTKELFK